MNIRINPMLFYRLSDQEKREAKKELLELKNGFGCSQIEALSQLSRHYGIIVEFPDMTEQVSHILSEHF